MDIIVRKKTVYICSSYILLVKVKHGDIGIVLEYHTCNNLVANLKVLTGAVFLNIFTHLYNLTCTLMSECNRDKTEWISLKFVCVCTANSAAFNLNENIVIADYRHRIFLEFKLAELCKHSNTCCSGYACICL